MNDTPNLLAIARGAVDADLLLSGGRVVNVFTGEAEVADVAIASGRIAGVGRGYRAKRTIDCTGRFVAPGLIDAHVHIESSLCLPAAFAAAVVPRGVTTVITDPHEIANVAGVAGVRFMADASRGLPLRVVIMAPSCVPATAMATAGATLTATDVAALRADGTAHGLAEVMNYPGVIGGDDNLLAKIAAMAGRPIDGHCPGVGGTALCAYAAAGVGSDHEAVTADEARAKLAIGLQLLVREATNARNLDALLPIITPKNSRRICFCTDDRSPGELLESGSVDGMVRRAIAFGIDPVEAIRLATLNTAEYFRLHDRGAIAPGRVADAIVFDDLQCPHATIVIAGGREVARGGKLVDPITAPPPVFDSIGGCTVDCGSVSFTIKATGDRVRVIGSLPDQLVTEHRVLPARIADGLAEADASRDLAKMAVIDRHGRGHGGRGNVGLGFIQGIGLRRGAIAGTVAHDHHNLVVIGVDDRSMHAAARAAARNGGGLAVADGEDVIAVLPLPVAGLMSDRPIAEVAAAHAKLIAAAKGLGSPLGDPFMAMSFMALEVIPSLKLTDKGLVDVEKFEIVDLFV
jgi:adenine deaminase